MCIIGAVKIGFTPTMLVLHSLTQAVMILTTACGPPLPQATSQRRSSMFIDEPEIVICQGGRRECAAHPDQWFPL